MAAPAAHPSAHRRPRAGLAALLLGQRSLDLAHYRIDICGIFRLGKLAGCCTSPPAWRWWARSGANCVTAARAHGWPSAAIACCRRWPASWRRTCCCSPPTARCRCLAGGDPRRCGRQRGTAGRRAGGDVPGLRRHRAAAGRGHPQYGHVAVADRTVCGHVAGVLGRDVPGAGAPLFAQVWSQLLPFTAYLKLQAQQLDLGAAWTASLSLLGTLLLFVLVAGGAGLRLYARGARDPASWGQR